MNSDQEQPAKLELEPQPTARLDAAGRLLEHLMTIVSHDLRGPLNAIMTSATLLQHKLAKLPIEGGACGGPGAKQIEVILRAVKQLDRRIGELLDVSSIATGSLKLELRSHEIGTLLKQSLAPFEPLASDNALQLRAEIPDRALVVSCDGKRLVQVLRHLIENAIKFTPDGGTIVISAEPQSERVRVSVQDSGVGIPAEELVHIFDRLKRPRDIKSQGPGLGLALARGIIEAHNGRMSAASEVGKGSMFSFTLPMRTASS